MCKIEKFDLKKIHSDLILKKLNIFLEKYIKILYWLLSVVSVWTGILLMFTNSGDLDVYLELLDNYKLKNYENNITKLENFYRIKTVFQVTVVIIKIFALIERITL